MDERTLHVRLARVEALHRQATTSGEREAAARARERLLERLVQVRGADPVAQFVHEQIDGLLVPGAPDLPPEPLPSVAELFDVLARWERGLFDDDEVCAWASSIVDRVDLPADPAEEGTVLGEVQLQLADLERVRLTPDDVPAVRAFVEGHGWPDWFALVARAAAR